MDLRQLEILRAVAETGSFTRAGARLHVSQSAVSRQILLLEAELNEALFLRIGRQIQITPAGELLLQLSERVLTDIRETCATITDRHKALSGTVRLVGGMTVCLYLFPRLVKALQRQHPEVEIKIAAGDAPRMMRRLRSARADLALLTLPVDEPGLTTVPVLREELILIMPTGHPLESVKHPVDPAALVGQPFIIFEPGSNSRRAIDDFFVREQVKPKIVSETENVEIMKAMVANGLGVSIVPFLAVEREARSGELAVARIRGPQLVRETGWVYRSTDRVPRILHEVMTTFGRIVPTLQLSPSDRPGASEPRLQRVR